MGNLEQAVERAETERPVVPNRTATLPIGISRTDEHPPTVVHARLASSLQRTSETFAPSCAQAGQYMAIEGNIGYYKIRMNDLRKTFSENIAQL